MTDREDQEVEDMIDAFTQEAMEMGKRYREAALRLAALRMYEIIYSLDDSSPSKKPLQKRLWARFKGSKTKPIAEDRRPQNQASCEKKVIIDLDPVTNETIRISVVDEIDLERRVDHEQAG